MTDEVRQALQMVIDFCSNPWREADQTLGQPADLKNGQQQAYNAVFHFSCELLDGTP
jgi:hypothetical protein